jgi:hypothetical protein
VRQWVSIPEGEHMSADIANNRSSCGENNSATKQFCRPLFIESKRLEVSERPIASAQFAPDQIRWIGIVVLSRSGAVHEL